MPLPSFPEIDRAAWRAQVTAELKGRDPDRVLLRHTEDGLALHPLYLSDDAQDPSAGAAGHRGTGPLPWGIDATYCWPDPAEAIAVDVAGGVTGLRIDPAGCGLRGASDVGALLPAPGLRVELVGAQHAAWLKDIDAQGSVLCGATDDVGALIAGGHTVVLSSEGWAGAGATGLQEIGWLLAACLRAIRGAVELGVDGAEAASRVHLTLTVGREVFPSIARLRAVRVLHGRALAAWGISSKPPTLRAVTHPGIATARDPWVNLLRSSHAAFAAIAGGADSLEVAPLDAAVGRPDALARRMARNTSQVLGLESHLGRVRDPAAGSWFLESLTAQTAQGAWAEFQRVGGDRGIEEAASSGRLEALCAASWDARTERLGSRGLSIIGVSEFPDAEPAIQREGEPRPVDHRDGEDWETLRARVEASGARVFVATWGPRAEWNARAMWVENLLRAGGFDVVTHAGGDPEDLPRAWTAAEAHAVCLCASDTGYSSAAAVSSSLREAGATILLLAGKGSPDTEAADLDLLLHAGAPVLERLTALAATVLDPSS
jgi:methylmalonyl-CoA mutase